MKARRLAGPGHDHQLTLAMKAIYGYDPAKWRLGSLCKHGHAWPCTQQSLRRIPSAKHPGVSVCAACGNGTPFWLAGFITGVEGGVLPPGTRLAKPCKRGHTYLDTGWCLRKDSNCVECLKGRRQREAPKVAERRKVRQRAWASRNAERINERRRERLQECPELRQRRIMRHREARYRQGAEPQELRRLQAAIRRSGRCPSVVQLIDAEQRRYWREHPAVHAAYRVERTRELWRWRYMTNPSLRRYHHEKSRRRKALERGNHVVRVTTAQIRKRFEQFGNCCAYCNASTSQLQTEHFLPISKGGTHVLSNILPACRCCNSSKLNHDPETWYRSQPFFTEQRWRMILRVLGKRQGAIGQLSLV